MQTMRRRRRGLVLTAASFALLLAGSAATPPLARGAAVTVRVEGTHKTLLPPTTGYTTPRVVGQLSGCEFPVLLCTYCPGRSTLGAIDSATKGRWIGKLDADDEYQLRGILGENFETSHGQWIMYLDNSLVTDAPCQVGIHKGQSLLVFAQTHGILHPLAIRIASHASAHHRLRVRVVAYKNDAVSTPVRGAVVTGGAHRVRTGPGGWALVRPAGRGRIKLQATKSGFVRSAVRRVSLSQTK
jgi:hypothetical protein